MEKVLQISGGRDSLALLYHMQPQWNELLVVWSNAGAPSKALVSLMDQVKQLVPHFLEVTGNVAALRKEHGDPNQDDWLGCCFTNIWKPMNDASAAAEAKQIIRGAKKIDPINFIGPGCVEAGLEYIFPIWDWTDEQVIESLVGKPLQPVYPHDCKNCPVTKICDRPELEAA